MPEMISDRLLSWATDLDDTTIEQAARTARLPIVEGHVALMPDAHLGYGATVGSVIPTKGAIIPSAVGVDIGCGMIAVDTTLDAGDLPDDLGPLLVKIEQGVPAGVGRAHDNPKSRWWRFGRDHESVLLECTPKQARTAAKQFGTLGSGNHFIEVCLDETDHVWVVLHSGSRGIGNQLASQHIKRAKGLLKERLESLEDPDLAYFVEGTPEFDAYVRDLQWAQAYAFENRAQMMDVVLDALASEVGRQRGAEIERDRINCHHNYAEREHHGGVELWITRKGAIRAREGDRGVIPGSMGAASFIVTGRGAPEAFESASHGAGRRMSRGQARREIDVTDFAAQMAGRTWLADRATKLLDEAPDAYKDIHDVMSAQADLVRIDHELRQILNFKGA